MVDPTIFATDFNNAVTDIGQPITITYNSGGYQINNDDYDEVLFATGSTSTISGVGFILPLSSKTAGADFKFMQEGKIRMDDSKLFVAGSLVTTGDMRITVGGAGSQYQVLPEGIHEFNVSGVTVYKRVYVRALTNANYYG